MDCTAALESIAGLLAGMPEESVEDLLVTFDGLVGVSDEGSRPAAAALLRNAAGSADQAVRRDRLLRAADAVEAAQPCALTADGLTVAQAAARQTVSEEQWEASDVPPPPPSDPAANDEDESPYMEEAPPKLPHLAVRDFFPGLVVRVGRDFADARGRAVCSGDLLTVLRSEATDDGCELSFLERRTVALRDDIAGHDAILGNSDNCWFQPVPTIACMEELLEAIERSIGGVEQDDDEDADALREELEECERWLSHGDERGPAPRLPNGRLAAKTFGRDHELARWIPLLFACADRFRPDSAPYQVEAPEPVKTRALQPGSRYQRFLSSMEINYSDWRDGTGYDLGALGESSDAEKDAAVELLAGRVGATPNWRDVEALGVIGSPAARAAIQRAVEAGDTETRLRAAEVLVDLGEPVDREQVIIDALRNSDLSNGLSQAIDDAEEHASPRIQESLLDLARNGNRDQRIHCAALALYAGGQSDDAFDWNHRPFFLSFGEEDEKTRLEAYEELCRRLNVAPKGN